MMEWISDLPTNTSYKFWANPHANKNFKLWEKYYKWLPKDSKQVLKSSQTFKVSQNLEQARWYEGNAPVLFCFPRMAIVMAGITV